MRIGLISDCHLEGDGDIEKIVDLLPSSPVDVFLVVGDATRAAWCFDLCLLIQNALDCDVIFTPGNHEYYSCYFEGCLMSDLEERWKEQFSKNSRIHYLQNSSVNIGGISFFGSTWWSNFEGDGQIAEDDLDFLSDFRFILTGSFSEKEIKLKKKRILEEYRHDDYLAHYLISKMQKRKAITREEMISLNRRAITEYRKWHCDTPGKKVLLSHFPMLASLRHTGFAPSSYFVSENRAIIEAYPPDFLVYGHTHCNIDTTDAGTRCVSNMYGYNLEAGYIGFDQEKVLEI